MKRLRAKTLHSLVALACEKMGAQPEDAARVADSLVLANLCGTDSHGVFRLAQYDEWWKKGLLDAASRPVLIE